jgi:hypothetical protein
MSDLYSKPEDFGLSTVGEVEWSEPNYDFDLTVLWRNPQGRLFWADDSGCSCPMPFEDFAEVGDLKTGTFFDFAKHLNDRLTQLRGSPYLWARTADIAHAEPQVVDLLSRAKAVAS